MNKVFKIIGLGMALGFGCHSEHEHHEDNTHFVVTSPLIMDTSITTEYVCQIHAIRHIELRALEKGYIESIEVDEGQFVNKGQLMFHIMPLLYNAELKKAEAEVEFAEIEYLNTKSLADSNIVSQNELSMVMAKYHKAQAELALAEAHLGFTEVKAPFNGIMDRLHVREGSLVEEGDLLTKLADNSKMWVYFNVPEAEYLNYKVKVKSDSIMVVKLLMANNQIFKYDGKVEVIEADFNNETGNIPFRATFPNPEGLLRHGETGNILIETQLSKATLIPQKATFEVLDQKYVFVVDKDHIVRTRRIRIAAEMPHLYAVKSGLDEKDQILLEGLRKVRNNDTIKVSFARPDSVLSHLRVYAE